MLKHSHPSTASHAHINKVHTEHGPSRAFYSLCDLACESKARRVDTRAAVVVCWGGGVGTHKNSQFQGGSARARRRWNLKAGKSPCLAERGIPYTKKSRFRRDWRCVARDREHKMGYCSVYPTPAGPSLTPGACETRSGKNVYLVYFATAELLGGSAVSRAIAGGAGGSGERVAKRHCHR